MLRISEECKVNPSLLTHREVSPVSQYKGIKVMVEYVEGGDSRQLSRYSDGGVCGGSELQTALQVQ